MRATLRPASQPGPPGHGALVVADPEEEVEEGMELLSAYDDETQEITQNVRDRILRFRT